LGEVSIVLPSEKNFKIQKRGKLVLEVMLVSVLVVVIDRYLLKAIEKLTIYK
jgi:hypothetical protein